MDECAVDIQFAEYDEVVCGGMAARVGLQGGFADLFQEEIDFIDRQPLSGALASASGLEGDKCIFGVIIALSMLPLSCLSVRRLLHSTKISRTYDRPFGSADSVAFSSFEDR